jgi:hypothetical protein
MLGLCNSGLSQPSGTIMLKSFKVSTVVSVLRTFFLKLPTPLLTFELHDVFLGATRTICFSPSISTLSFSRLTITLYMDLISRN